MDESSLPTDPNKYNVFVFYTGYVESQSLSPVIISMSRDHQFPPAATWKEAWETAFASCRKVYLAALKHHNSFDEEDGAVLRNCCQEALRAKRAPRFCPDCGTSLREAAEKTFPSGDSEEETERRTEMSMEFLEAIVRSSNDGWGNVWELTYNRGWVIPGHLEPGYVTVIHSYSESLLVNYESEKETWKWDKEAQFWTESMVDIMKVL